MNIPSDQTQTLLVRLIEASALRHKVLANNLANASTPGFIRKDVSFEAELAEAADRGDATAFSPSIQDDLATPVRADGNNVAADRELAEINKNALIGQMAIQLLQTKLAMQRLAINGRG